MAPSPLDSGLVNSNLFYFPAFLCFQVLKTIIWLFSFKYVTTMY